MENLEVRSKSYLIKWINAPDNSVINYEIKPLKHSINFGIYTYKDAQTPKTNLQTVSLEGKLNNSNLKQQKWVGRINGDELVKNRFKVQKASIYAFVFDNSFSKTVGKKILFNQYIEETSNGEKLYAPNDENISIARSDHKENNVKFNVTLEDGKQAEKSKISASTKTSILKVKGGQYLQGFLLKKKRKKGGKQFNRRFFVLNFKYGILNYYLNEGSKHVRGNMFIKSVVVSADYHNKTIVLDSGLEIWHLKALSQRDWDVWVQAFNFVKKLNYGGVVARSEVEAPVLRKPELHGGSIGPLLEIETKLTKLYEMVDNVDEKKKFWHKKKFAKELQGEISTLQKDIAQLIQDSSFVKLDRSNSRKSAETSISQEFYDADDFLNEVNSGVVRLDGGETEPMNDALEQVSQASSSTSSSEEEEDDDVPAHVPVSSSEPLYPLYMLERVHRRKDIPRCTVGPPSMASILRKSVGKDFTSITMPVSANEPLSLLQKYAEMFEYCDLIDTSLEKAEDSGEKIAHIAAFAISNLSSLRVKERCQRKPFNPLLGETYELVREDLGFRMIAEKVCHKPTIMAIYAESANWTLSFSPQPDQKLWGKSAEITTKGEIVLVIKPTGDVYKWTQPVTMLRNLIAGEKYSEPSDTMEIHCSDGSKAVVTFKAGSMFSGRSEDLTVVCYNRLNSQLPFSLSGKWTSHLSPTTGGSPIWCTGALVDDASHKFGFTEFAASLNDITSVEDGEMAPTDSRLRPDQRKYELGDVGGAESDKLRLEESQRQRRNKGEEPSPAFFTQVEAPEGSAWEPVTGENGYWEKRQRKDWSGLVELW